MTEESDFKAKRKTFQNFCTLIPAKELREDLMQSGPYIEAIRGVTPYHSSPTRLRT